MADAVNTINGHDRDSLYEQLLAVARKKTADADAKFDDRGRKVKDQEELEFGESVLIVPTEEDALE